MRHGTGLTIDTSIRTASTSRWIVGGAYFVALAGTVALYAADPEAAHRLLRGWMEHPFRYPFVDWEWISRSLQCWRRGVDVYTENPCVEPVAYPLWAYSPLWLRLSFLPAADAWVRPIALGMAFLFGLALASLPPVRRWQECVVLVLAAVSSMTAFALERANADLIIFLLTVAGVLLWQRSGPIRLISYAIFLFAGLLKFYPVVLLALVARERLRVAVPVALVAVLALVAFVLGFGDELRHAVRNVAHVWYFGDGFGAVTLPLGLAAILPRLAGELGLGDPAALHWPILFLKNAALPCLIAASLAAALRLAGAAGLASAMARLELPTPGLLVAGSLLIVGCFLSGQSIGYRAIFLIPTLPGLFALARTLPSPAARRLVGWTSLAMLFVMWTPSIHQLIEAVGLGRGDLLDADPAGLVLWLFAQLAWWWIFGVLLAVLLGFAANAEALVALRDLLLPGFGRVRAGRGGRVP